MTGEDEEQKPDEGQFIFETSENSSQEPALEGLAGPDLNLDAETPSAEAQPSAEAPVDPFATNEEAPPAEAEPAISLDGPAEEPAAAPIALDAPPEPVAEAAPIPAPPAPIEEPTPKINVPASFPFSLMVEGHLTPSEQEKLLDVLSRESMGIRELDLETQFQCGRILIPRISEYAGVLLVQALRTASVEIKLVPSDLGELIANSEPPATDTSEKPASDFSHPAEQVRVTQTDTLPDLPSFEVIGVMTASAILKTESVEAEGSAQYTELLEGLTREMKYKAFRKGAVGIVKFQVQLTSLRASSSDYRLTVTGTAIKPQATDAALEPPVS